MTRFSCVLTLSTALVVLDSGGLCAVEHPRRRILAWRHNRSSLISGWANGRRRGPGRTRQSAGHGTNSIKRILDGCVVQENFSGQGTPPFHGTSLSIYDLKPGKWKQTWVDNQGAYLDFVGEFKDGQMILQREATGPDGKAFLQRMVWKNIAANEFDWSWEASHDGGKSWQVQWPIHYKRKG